MPWRCCWWQCNCHREVPGRSSSPAGGTEDGPEGHVVRNTLWDLQFLGIHCGHDYRVRTIWSRLHFPGLQYGQNYMWDKMCRKNSDPIHVIVSPSLWLQCALLCLCLTIVKTFDLIPKLRAMPDYQLSSGIKYTVRLASVFPSDRNHP